MKTLKTMKMLKEIMKLVSEQYGLDITQTNRRKDLVMARWVYYKLCRDFTPASLAEIGKSLNKNHATVLHGLKGFENWQLQKSYYADHIEIYEKISQLYEKKHKKPETLIDRVRREKQEVLEIHRDITKKYEQLKEKHNRMLKYFTRYERNALEKHGV